MFGSTSKPILLAQKALMCMLQSKYLFSFWAAILKPASHGGVLGRSDEKVVLLNPAYCLSSLAPVFARPYISYAKMLRFLKKKGPFRPKFEIYHQEK